MCGVVALRGAELPAGARQQSKMSAPVMLRQGGSKRIRAGVKVESEWLRPVGMHEDGGVSKSLLQLRESQLMELLPGLLRCLLSKEVKGAAVSAKFFTKRW